MRSMTMAGGAAPPVATLVRTGSGRLASAGACTSMLSTIGAPHMCVTRCSAMAVEDALGLDLAQADVRAAGRGDRPGEGPARAVEHRQRPQVAALVVELEGERVGERAEVGAAMAVDRALGIAGRARRIEQADAVPLVLGAADRRSRHRRRR